MKQFNLESAKVGVPVCTVSGRDVTIYDFEYNGGSKKIAGKIKWSEGDEAIASWCEDGRFVAESSEPSGLDLVMKPQHQELWTNVFYYKCDPKGRYMSGSFETKEAAEGIGKQIECYVQSIKVEWTENDED